jgi:Ca-activated chloride channel family protein
MKKSAGSWGIISQWLAAILSLLMLGGSHGFGQSGRKANAPEEQEEEGQQQREAETSEVSVSDEVLRIGTQEVLVPVSVRDALGMPVAGLSSNNFFLYDNGVRQEIISFNRHRVPANIVLLLDASGSVFTQMRLIRKAAKTFLQGLLSEDRVCLMQFAEKVELLQDWTAATETSSLEKAIDWRYHPGESTSFYDGLYLAAQEQLGKVEGRRIIILLTDGIDTAEKARASYADALAAVRRTEASVYVVSLTSILRTEIEKKTGGRWSKLFGGYDPKLIRHYLLLIEEAEKRLTELATQTGGRIFLPLKEEELMPAYTAIAEELRTQYILTYKPQPRAGTGEWRRIRVLVSPGGYEVATREGYTVRY